ncbi:MULTISPECIES: hypothetical protein [unclassified Mycobacterium]|uniref:hypothetical protein n=1 Tax=unclassified Mycobacterium TaxID=2642494 RepID=UPI001E632742|nr:MULTISPECIES: hypothetical protein [unclassified Mycobacterium]
MITQLRAASDKPSSFWILGSAKIATGPSIDTISCMPPIATTTATNRRDRNKAGMRRFVWCNVVGSTDIRNRYFAASP